jgi:hypothetical protein
MDGSGTSSGTGIIGVYVTDILRGFSVVPLSCARASLKDMFRNFVRNDSAFLPPVPQTKHFQTFFLSLTCKDALVSS